MKKIFYLLILLNPLISFAQGYQPLVSNSPISSAASSVNLEEFLKQIFNWGIGAAVALAILFIILGGVQYMTTDAIFAKEEGRKRIQAAVAGLLIALSSWLILFTINPKIFENSLGLSNLGNSNTTPVNVGGGDIGGNNSPGTNPPTNQNPPINPGGESPVFYGDEQFIRDALAQQGVTINKNPCTFPGQENCTDVVGFRQSTMAAISNLNRAVGGNGFVITGGTEKSKHAAGTYSHGNGYKFDVGQGSNPGNWDKIDNYYKGLIGSQVVSDNKVYPVTVLGTGQKLELIREKRGDSLHWDIKALP
jgi:hypothetical protein